VPAARTAPDLPVVIYGDPRLRVRCREVGADEDVRPLVAAMQRALRDHDGVGLAAPQIGDCRRVILVGDPERPQRPARAFINPTITQRFGPDVPFEEGCLSFPDLFVWLDRPRGIELRYRDLSGAERTLRDEGVIARICQHEVDHLDGVLFVDHLPRWRRWLLGGRLWRLRRRGRAASEEAA
jgi:peptide deformylase